MYACLIARRLRRAAVVASLILAPAVGQAQTTALFFDSQPGDYIGAGERRTYTPDDGTFSIGRNFSNGVTVEVEGPSLSFWWRVEFSAWEAPLAVGTYVGARRFPFSPLVAFNISGSGRGCNNETGRYIVREIVYGPDGSIVRFAADFEQHCEDAVPALFGSIRYNSTVSDLTPFGGNYPRYQLTITPPLVGSVSAPGISCGSGENACETVFGSAASVALNALAPPGYIFGGWTGDCYGPEATSLHVNGPKACGALFEPITPTQPRTRLHWISEPGDYIGQGEGIIFTPANSVWSVGDSDARSVVLRVSGLDAREDSYWTLMFSAPEGETLRAGTRYSTQSVLGKGPAQIAIFGNGRGCAEAGEFTVRELVRTDTMVTRVAIDFEQHCNSLASPALRGALQYQSTIDMAKLFADRTTLSFGVATNTSGGIVARTPSQTIRLTQTGPRGLTWRATSAQPWLSVTPSEGTGPATLTVSIAGSGPLPAPTVLGGAISIWAPLSFEPVPPVIVNLTVNPQSTSAPPFGAFDTPATGSSGLAGSVAVTGWALDDVEVARVEIWRQAHPNDPPAAIRGGRVFIGLATFVEGARPDVEQAHPALPLRTRAGWGYLMLTRGLVWDGHGPFEMYAIAVDREGRASEIGKTLISVNNAVATKPFGTIDTPGQGETVSGIYPVTGWVLTPNVGATIPAGNVLVAIDGVFLSDIPTMSDRQDITTGFPAFNTSGAGRGLFIDTTTLLDGMHTIGWFVSDTTNEADGIGSRFFTVSNTLPVFTSNLTAAPPLPVGLAASRCDADAIDWRRLPPSVDVLQGRRGGSAATPYRQLADGVLHATELERVELRLPYSPGDDYAGYLLVGGQLRPLPIGSHLDGDAGAFTWQPGVGFVGTYDLLFLRCGERERTQRLVRIVLHPQGTLDESQVIVDVPSASSTVSAPFLVAGWALDPAAIAGTGIDAVHVWAYPADGAAPFFLGAAALAGKRPDVAALYGPHQESAGYGLLVRWMPAGHYTIAIFARRAADGIFLPARTVPVLVR